LNVDFFNTVSEEDKKLWNEQCAIRWNVECDQIIRNYSDYFDNVVLYFPPNSEFQISVISG